MYLIVFIPDLGIPLFFSHLSKDSFFVTFDNNTVPLHPTEGIEACQFFMRNGCKLEGSI